MTAGTTREFAAFIGLDWADAQHDICLQVAGSDKRAWTTWAHRPAVIAAWAPDLRQRFQGQPIAIALELNQGPMVEAIRKYDRLVLFHINPLRLARYRQAFTPSRAKDDPTDAALQLALFLRHREKLKPLVPQSPEMRALAPLVEHRRRLGGARVRRTHRLIRTLKTYFPPVLQWLPQQDTRLCCDFLRQWPTLNAAQRARRRILEQFLHQHHVRGEQRLHECLAAIKSAVPLTTDAGGMMPNALMAQALMAQWRVL